MVDTPTVGQLARAAAEAEANALAENGNVAEAALIADGERPNGERPEPKPLTENEDWMAATARRLPVVEEPVAVAPRRRLAAVTEEPATNPPNGGLPVPERRRVPRVEEPVTKTDPISGRSTSKKDDAPPQPDLSDASNAGAHLLAFVGRIERLEEEKKALGEDIKDVYSEAKDNGFNTKIIRRVVATLKKDAGKLAEEEEIFDLYWRAISRGR
jgi:uncharacterized protein (UPF0335 family)